MSFMAGATCAMCLRGVHYKRGRVACDGCDLPTDCCLCEPQEAAATGPLALASSAGSRVESPAAGHELADNASDAP
ncbi:MAG: hypothetical protein ACRD0U_01050 [Acidimicrobiales bacterium]